MRAWEARTALALTALAMLFLAVYAIPILWPNLAAGWRKVCEVANVLIWAAFAADFATRVAIHPRRWVFVRTHLFDLAVLLLPVLRPLRALRVVTAVLALGRRGGAWARGRLAVYVGGTTVLLVVVAALAVLDAERGHPDGNIGSYPEALWWAVVTITTVGYGDHFPVTVAGKWVAVGLMVGGIGLIGFVTGTLASWIVDRVSTADRPQEATKADIEAVLEELAALRAEISRLRTPS